MSTMPMMIAQVVKCFLVLIVLAFPALSVAVEQDRFDAALSAAAIQQKSLANPIENSLILGNGDLNGVLFAGGPGLVLRVTKNDVWDARLDTSSDPALAVFDVSKHKVVGGTNKPGSLYKPYPCPIACAVIGLGSKSGPTWQPVRGEGKSNHWTYVDNSAVMSIEGNAGTSCGWSALVESDLEFNKLRLRLSGTANARYYVSVNGKTFESGWRDTPSQEQDVVLDLPGKMKVTSIILYTWTTDKAKAENRFTALEFQGPDGNHALDLSRLSPPSPDYRLDVRRAVANIPGKSKSKTVNVRALADRNVFLIEGDIHVTLSPTTAGFVPKPERGSREDIEYLVQNLPPDPGFPEKGDWPGMSFVVAKATQHERSVIAIVTSLESSKPLEDALALARDTLAENAASLHKKHDDVWAKFWSVSQVNLADTYLRDEWYRNLYFMRCISKAGAKPVGLFAGMLGDVAAWHGDFHLNYNAQQTYWSWYACNHAELSEPYETLIKHALPRAKWFARTSYDCNGAFYPYNLFLHEPVDPATSKSRNNRQFALVPYTYTLGVSGWAIQNNWLHYKYYPDQKLLETEVYPLLKEVAEFYADFADKCKVNPAGKIVFGPTYSPEHWNLGRDDGACDIAFARMTLKAAIESANLLGADDVLAKRWQQTLEKLPDYPRTKGEEPVVVDVAGVPPTAYNVPVPALPVYPAEEITWFFPEADKKVFADTISKMRTNGENSFCILAAARARLSMPDTYEWTRREMLARQRPNGTLSLSPRGGRLNGYGHYTEMFAVTGAITEMLLQSAGGAIRVFPAWPKDQDAAFVNLRAEGGFLVAAEQKAGEIVKLQITSTVGGKLRLLNPWTNMITERHMAVGEIWELSR